MFIPLRDRFIIAMLGIAAFVLQFYLVRWDSAGISEFVFSTAMGLVGVFCIVTAYRPDYHSIVTADD